MRTGRQMCGAPGAPRADGRGAVQVTCFRRSFLCPAVYDGGSHSSSKSIFMNSSTVSWLVGVSSNSVSLKRGRGAESDALEISHRSSTWLVTLPLRHPRLSGPAPWSHPARVWPRHYLAAP